MENSTAALIGALVGATVSGGIAVLNAYLQRRAETKARILDTALSFAATEWRGHLDTALKRGGAVIPPTVYVAHAVDLMRLYESNAEFTAQVLFDMHHSFSERINEFLRLESARDELKDASGE